MPTALIVTIRPQTSGRVAAHLGRAAHAAVLRRLAQDDAALAARLHANEPVKPLTVSSVLGLSSPGERAAHVEVTPAQTYRLRVTLLSPELEAVVAPWQADTIGTLVLDNLAWQVDALTTDTAVDAWAGQASYEQIAAPVLRGAAPPATHWTLDFASPVTFRQRAMNQPLPLPGLVFGSLLHKWNAFAPLTLPEDVRDAAGESLAISRFDLHSVATPTKNRAMQIGAVGRCTYTATTRDRALLACFDILARFAFYASIGSGATRGFGQVRLCADGVSTDR